MKKWPLLASMMVIMFASVFVGAGTVAYFSNTGSSTDNVFTAGTCDLQLWGSSWSDDVSGTWTFSNMAPGDIVSGTLYVKNTGSVAIKALLCDLDVTAETDGGSDGKHLDDYLYCRFWAGYGPDKDTITWGYGPSSWRDIRDVASTLEGLCTDSDNLLGLSGMPSQIDTSGGNDVVALQYEFEFKETGGDQNHAQGDSVTIRYKLEARSSTCP